MAVFICNPQKLFKILPNAIMALIILGVLHIITPATLGCQNANAKNANTPIHVTEDIDITKKLNSTSRKQKTKVNKTKSVKGIASSGIKAIDIMTLEEKAYLDYTIKRGQMAPRATNAFQDASSSPGISFSPNIHISNAEIGHTTASDVRNISGDVVELLKDKTEKDFNLDKVVKDVVKKEEKTTGIKQSEKEREKRVKSIIPAKDSFDYRIENLSKSYIAFGISGIMFGFGKGTGIQSPPPVKSSSNGQTIGTGNAANIYSFEQYYNPFVEGTIRIGRNLPFNSDTPKSYAFELVLGWKGLQQGYVKNAKWDEGTFATDNSTITGSPNLPSNFGTANLFYIGFGIKLELAKIRISKFAFYPMIGTYVSMGLMQFPNDFQTAPVAPIIDIVAGIFIPTFKRFGISVSYKLSLIIPTLYSNTNDFQLSNLPNGFNSAGTATNAVSYSLVTLHQIELIFYF